MAEDFTPLDAFLRPPIDSEPACVETEAAVPVCEATPPDLREAIAEVKRFRAAVADAVDVAVDALLCDIAASVLARELEVAPANLREIVARACRRHANEPAVRVRAHPDEIAQLAESGNDTVADRALRRGDALLEVRAGTIDLTLGARLAAVLSGAT